jgi:hypothetical protein
MLFSTCKMTCQVYCQIISQLLTIITLNKARVWKKRIEDIEYTATIFNNSLVWESLSQIWGCWDEYYKHCLSLEDDMRNLSNADFSRTVCYTSKWWLLITVHRSHLTISLWYFLELCYSVSDHLIHLPDCWRFRYMNFSSAFLFVWLWKVISCRDWRA